MDDRDVPTDFPQEFLAAVPGAQPKLLVHRTADGRYVDQAVGYRAERWVICVDLREQLADYVIKHAPPSTTHREFVERVSTALERKRKEWGMSLAEAEWIRKELRQRFTDS